MPINSSTYQPFNPWLVSTSQPGPAVCAKRLNLPSCERKAAQSNVFRYLQMSVAYLFVLFVRKHIFSKNRLCIFKINVFLLLSAAPGPLWGHFWPLLGLSWPLLAALGPLLAALGLLLAPLGRSWVALGRSWLLWARSGPLLGRSWVALVPLLGRSGAALSRSWVALDRS
jgi:hypothetical protein